MKLLPERPSGLPPFQKRTGSSSLDLQVNSGTTNDNLVSVCCKLAIRDISQNQKITPKNLPKGYFMKIYLSSIIKYSFSKCRHPCRSS